MAFIEPMHRTKPNITYLLTYIYLVYRNDKFIATNRVGPNNIFIVWIFAPK